MLLALRHIGAARTGAYFAIAPFIGAAVSLLCFEEAFSVQLLLAGLLMALGLWLHLTEHHCHLHEHEEIEHCHEHIHEHVLSDPPGEPHTHTHKHTRFFYAAVHAAHAD